MARDWKRYIAVIQGRRDGLTLRACGKLIGVSHERARQMEYQAIYDMVMGKDAVTHLLPLTSREKSIYDHNTRRS